MRLLRSLLMLAVSAGLAACGGSDECTVPRTGNEETCDSYNGTQLRFIVGEPPPDVSAYCASACVDVESFLAIAGYDDLRRVPFLAKVRRIGNLGINVDGLKNLKGLERVDIVHELSLSGLTGETLPKTLDGLADEEMESFWLDAVTGLESLIGAPKKVDSFAVTRSSLQTLDLRAVASANVSIEGNDRLQSIALGSGPLNQLTVRANPALRELTWDPGLTIRRSVRIDANTSLSSCRVQELVDQTKIGARSDFVLNNGPCP